MDNSDNSKAGKPVKLLHIVTVPVTLSFLDGHVGYAKSRGFEVHALASPGAFLDKFGADNGIEVHAVSMPRKITPLRDLAAVWKIGRILRRLRPDIVHAHTPKGGLLGMIASWNCGIPVRIYHLHGLPLETARYFRRFLLRWTEKISCRLASQVLCVSRSLRDRALSEGLCPAEKIKVVLHGHIKGVDAVRIFNPDIDRDAGRQIRSQYGIPADALVAGFVGRIVRDKGLIELTEAWQTLREELPNLHLLLVGPFEPQDPVPPDVETVLRSDRRIHLAGEITDIRNMPRFFRAMDLLVLPTYREGYPTVLLEAAAMGLPAVSTRVSGCVDAVVDGETGTLVPCHDAGALVAAMRAYLKDGELRRRHGQAGRERILGDFRPEDMSQAIHQEYIRLLRQRRSGEWGVESGEWQVKSGEWGVENGESEVVIPAPQSANINPRSPLSTPHSPLHRFYRRCGKRIFDLLASVMALVVLGPVLLLLAVLIRIWLGAPVLFRQERTGFARKPFMILKFRTMTNERDASGELLPDSQRLTRLGRFLRHTSFDELPELLNVLKGDMSLVGPRPLLPRYDSSYSEREARRFDVLPGITGWAQINGRNDLAWDDRLECDAWYAESYGLGLDLKILLLTVVKVLRRDNVQVDPGLTFGYLDEERSQRARTKDPRLREAGVPCFPSPGLANMAINRFHLKAGCSEIG